MACFEKTAFIINVANFMLKGWNWPQFLQNHSGSDKRSLQGSSRPFLYNFRKIAPAFWSGIPLETNHTVIHDAFRLIPQLNCRRNPGYKTTCEWVDLLLQP